MKVSDLTKQLNSIKRKHGNIDVGIDTFTIYEDADLEFAVEDVNLIGVFKVGNYESRKKHKCVILGGRGLETCFKNEKNLLVGERK